MTITQGGYGAVQGIAVLTVLILSLEVCFLVDKCHVQIAC